MNGQQKKFNIKCPGLPFSFVVGNKNIAEVGEGFQHRRIKSSLKEETKKQQQTFIFIFGGRKKISTVGEVYNYNCKESFKGIN